MIEGDLLFFKLLIMKKIKLLTGCLILCLCSMSCSKSKENIDKSAAPVKSNIQPTTNSFVNKIQNFTQLNLPQQQLPTSEQEAKLQCATLQSNSVSYLYTTLGLTTQDIINQYGSLEAPEISLTALTFQILDTMRVEGSNICNQSNKYLKCAVESVIPCQTINALYNLTDGAISMGSLAGIWSNLPENVKSQILGDISRFAGKKLTYVAVAWMVYDFATCLIAENPGGPTLTHTRRDSLINESLIIVPGSYAYTFYHSHIGRYLGQSSNYVPFVAGNLFYDLNSAKYYLDATFTKVAPNGFYIDWNELSTGNQIYKYKEIQNGMVVQVAYALNYDPYRFLETFDSSTHAPFLP